MLGTVFRVLTQDTTLADQVDALFSDFETTRLPARAGHILQLSGEPGETHRLHRNCSRVASRKEGEDLLPQLVSVINREAIGACDHFAVHAAVVADRDRVIALPADTGGGKTTLAAALALGGFSYVSDEALVLDDDGKVIPYPKPLALSPWTCRALGLPGSERGDERLFTSTDLGTNTRAGSFDLTHLIVARYGEGETTLRPRPRSISVTELLSHSFNHYKNPERAFRLATETARRVEVWELGYDSPVEAAELLRRELG